MEQLNQLNFMNEIKNPLEPYILRLQTLLREIEVDQVQHLRNLGAPVFESIAESSTYNNAFIDASRAVKNTVGIAFKEVLEISEHYNFSQ